MAENSKIEWVDHTASPWHGCDEVHKGCDNCYARMMAKRNPGTLGVWVPNGTRVKSVSFHANCRRWNKEAEQTGKRATVFPSICDPFEDWQGPINGSNGWVYQLGPDRSIMYAVTIPPQMQTEDGCRLLTMDDLRAELFATIDACPHLDFILLTKRPENVRRMWPSADVFDSESEHKAYWPNVWLLTSISDQATADAMIPHLLQCRDLVPVLGLSCEPLLSSIDLSRWLRITWQCSGCKGYFGGKYQKVCPDCGKSEYWCGSHIFNGRGFPPQDVFPIQAGIAIDWVIVGGESGHGARPYDLAWPRSIIRQCKASGVPCFHKQVGSRPFHVEDLSREPCSTATFDRYLDLTDPKGGDMAEWPEYLRVREYPKAVSA